MKSARRKAHKKSKVYITIMGGLFILFLFYVWQRVQVVEVSYDILRLKKQISEWESENYSLQKQINHYASLERIAFFARNRLGMVLPGKEDVLMLPDLQRQPKALKKKFTTLLRRAHRFFGVERAEAERNRR